MSETIDKVRSDFPALNRMVHGKPLVYLDNAATTQKPSIVIDTIDAYYRLQNSNVHRGVHTLSQEATTAFETVRDKIAAFIHAGSREEIIFTRGATEAINLVAFSFGEAYVNEGDEILISALEHHSNIVPWQQVCKRKKAVLKVIPITPAGDIDMYAYTNLLGSGTRLVAVNHISNSLGTINPVKEIVQIAHSKGVPVLIDGAQGLSHGPVDVIALDCDFYAFSAHKAYGPMGIGGLYGKRKWLNEMPPYQSGGEMIHRVTFEETTFNVLPYKFEAGTPSVADALGFGAAIDYLSNLGWDFIRTQESGLIQYATERLSELPEVTIVGNPQQKASILSFLIDGIHFFDAGTILDHMGIAVRTGNHCTQPLMDQLELLGTLRASFAFYNTLAEVDKLCEGIRKVKELFG